MQGREKGPQRLSTDNPQTTISEKLRDFQNYNIWAGNFGQKSSKLHISLTSFYLKSVEIELSSAFHTVSLFARYRLFAKLSYLGVNIN